MPWERTFDLSEETRPCIGRRTVSGPSFLYLLKDPERDGGSKIRNAQRPFALLLAYPKYAFLEVKAEYGPPGNALPFATGDAALRAVQEYKPDPKDLLGEDWRREWSVLGAVLNGKTRIALTITYDTDEHEYCGLAAKHRADLANDPTRKFFEEFKLLAKDETYSESGTLTLTLGFRPLESYRGQIALDFGNTNTNLAFLPEKADDPHEILLTNANKELGETGKHAEAVESSVLLTHLVTDSGGTNPGRAAWIIGERGRKLGSDGLAMGLKRRVASQKHTEPRPLLVRPYLPGRLPLGMTSEAREQMVPGSFPAELFVCRLLQAFSQATSFFPQRLAITYPTTFSTRELKNLREIVYRGWMRARACGHTAKPPPIEDVLRLELDEASAAAFFFVYRKAFDFPMGLPGFEYIYPEGFNLLLFDCGGGTTDVALVQAKVDTDAQGKRLILLVRGRGGMRDFGGDDITVAVFRLLKAKIALAVAQRVAPGALPGWGLDSAGQPCDADPDAALRIYLDENAERFDSYLRTSFRDRRRHVGDDATRKLRDRTLYLWYEAEKLKRKLRQEEEAPFTHEDNNAFNEALAEVLPSEEVSTFLEELKQVRVSRKEVDVLILPRLLRGIKQCNHLIYDKLTSHLEDVHWVVVAGNASLYPLVGQLLQTQLDVLNRATRLMPIDDHAVKDLKSAVAKGALLAMVKREVAGHARVEFESHTLTCLPFDIGLAQDQLGKTVDTVFEEGLTFEQCQTPRPLKLAHFGPQARKVELRRHWPGEKMDDGKSNLWDKFLYYDFPSQLFPRGVPETVHVFYHSSRREFMMRANGQEIVPREATPEEVYWSPVESGEL